MLCQTDGKLIADGARPIARITGGTGKFEGLQASLVITVDPVKGNLDGISQVIGHKKGTYKFAKTK
jgi:hypothetical protein